MIYMYVSIIVWVSQYFNTYFFLLTLTSLLCPEKDQSQMQVIETGKLHFVLIARDQLYLYHIKANHVQKAWLL